MFDSNDMKLGSHAMRAVTAHPLSRSDGARPPRLHHPHPTLVSPQRTRSLIRESQGEAAWILGCTPRNFVMSRIVDGRAPGVSEPLAPIYIALLFSGRRC